MVIKMKQNLEKMVELAQIVNDENLSKRIFSNYEKESKSTGEIIIACIVLFILFVIYRINQYELAGQFLEVFKIGLLVLVLLMYIIWTCYVHRFRRAIRSIKNNNEPLLWYSSDIIKKYVKEDYRRDRNYTKHFIELINDITLEIEWRKYNEIESKGIQKVNIYFYERLLKDNKFELEFI